MPHNAKAISSITTDSNHGKIEDITQLALTLFDYIFSCLFDFSSLEKQAFSYCLPKFSAFLTDSLTASSPQATSRFIYGPEVADLARPELGVCLQIFLEDHE